MSIHISASSGAIADTVLIPGDPKRAELIAKKCLTEIAQYTSVRNMSGFTGLTPQGKKLSVQGGGIGMPSNSIYYHELIVDYGVKCLIRVGTCGALRPDVKLGDIVLAQGACSNSAMNVPRFHPGINFAPLADFNLLTKFWQAAEELGIPVRAGNIFSTDTFYSDERPEIWQNLARYGALAVEMESAELFTLAVRHQVSAATILMVSDSLIHHTSMTCEQREEVFPDMVKIIFKALDL